MASTSATSTGSRLFPTEKSLPGVPVARALPVRGIKREVTVAVMGLTGTGKSSFIKAATGDARIHIGDTLDAGTHDIKDYILNLDGIKYRLVDTPGFDDPSDVDEVVVDRLLKWLEDTYRRGERLNGIVYLHSINETRMKGSARQSLDMFQQLCGPSCYKNIVLATTFWDKVTEATGAQRERELRENDQFWGLLVKQGSQVVRLSREEATTHQIIKIAGNHEHMVLKAQHEIVNEKKKRRDTAAALRVQEAKRLEKEREERLEQEKERVNRQLAEEARQREVAAKMERAAAQARIRERERKEREARAATERYAEILRKRREEERKEAERKEAARVAAEVARVKREAERRAELRRQAEAEALEERKEMYLARTKWCANKRPYGGCDNCGTRLSTQSVIYHCCSCLAGDNYWHCCSCGNDCGNVEHPWMSRLEANDCIVM